MMAEAAYEVHRRGGPRVAVESFCSEYVGDKECHGLVVELSHRGLRVQRPMRGALPRSFQLEFEIPEVDEVVWAQAEVCFDQLWQVPSNHNIGPNGILRTSGVRLVRMAARHERLIREFVTEKWRQADLEVSENDLMFASCYRFG